MSRNAVMSVASVCTSSTFNCFELLTRNLFVDCGTFTKRLESKHGTPGFTAVRKGLVDCISTQVPGITLFANMIWFPNEFILMKCPQLANCLDKKALATVTAHRHMWLTQTNQSIARCEQLVLLRSLELMLPGTCCYMYVVNVFFRTAHSLQLVVSSWLVKMESNCIQGLTLIESLNHRCLLFIEVTFLLT